MMQRRSLLIGGLAALALAGPAAAQSVIPLDRISAYLNSLTTAEARFTQIADDGSVQTGKLYIHRPYRMRFEYDPPNPTLVLAYARRLAIFDGKSNRVDPEEYPLRHTPLNLILEQRVDLSRRNMVVDHYGDGTTTTVVAQDPENPEYGRLELIFTDNPVQLRQWVVTDGSGARTTVILGDMVVGKEYSRKLFAITEEIRRRGGGRDNN